MVGNVAWVAYHLPYTNLLMVGGPALSHSLALIEFLQFVTWFLPMVKGEVRFKSAFKSIHATNTDIVHMLPSPSSQQAITCEGNNLGIHSLVYAPIPNELLINRSVTLSLSRNTTESSIIAVVFYSKPFFTALDTPTAAMKGRSRCLEAV